MWFSWLLTIYPNGELVIWCPILSQCQVLPERLGVWRGCTLVVQHGTQVCCSLVWMELAYVGLYTQNHWVSITFWPPISTNGFKKWFPKRFRVYCIAQVPCTEIIQSAVADVADMAAISNDDPNKKCPVLCALSKVNLHKSDTQSNFRTNLLNFVLSQHFLHGRVWTPTPFVYTYFFIPRISKNNYIKYKPTISPLNVDVPW